MRSISALAVTATVFVAVPMADAATVPVSITSGGFVPASVTATREDQELVYSSKVMMAGELSSKKAGVDVAVLAKPCGSTVETRLVTVQTTAGGAFGAEPRTARNTAYTVQAGTTTSDALNVKVAPRLRLGRVAAHRYWLRVFAAHSFAGKYAMFQRFVGSRWISVKRLRLQKNSTNSLPTVISSVPFAWTSNSRQRVRAILPQRQAGTCYPPGTSNEIRSLG
jgi:hypothetical protein